jgi:hypothetical protein
LWISSCLETYFPDHPLNIKKPMKNSGCCQYKKVKLSLCLTKHHAMKAYWGVEV